MATLKLLDSAVNVRKMSASDVGKLNKDQLQKALKLMMSEEHTEETGVMLELHKIHQENAEILQGNKDILGKLTKIDELENDMTAIKKELTTAYEIINQQQMFMEYLDNKDRECNVVIMGLSEQPDEIGEADHEKVMGILNVIGECSTNLGLQLKRLGKPNDANKRPLHVRFQDKSTRQSVVGKAKLLKTAEGAYKKVFIKKDIHPVVRKEMDRLRIHTHIEAAKPENAGTDIRYDHKRRVILRDGLVIDRFSPSFF